MIKSKTCTNTEMPTTLADGSGGFSSCPNLLTEDVYYLRWIGEDGREKYQSLVHSDKREAERQRRERSLNSLAMMPASKVR